MAINKKKAWDEYHRTGVNHSNYDLNDRDEIAAITGWNCARDKGRADAFRDYHRTGVNQSKYNLNDYDHVNSILDGIKYRD